MGESIVRREERYQLILFSVDEIQTCQFNDSFLFIVKIVKRTPVNVLPLS